MKQYAELDQTDIITSHKALNNIFKRKMTLRNVPARHIPKGLSIEQLESYLAFAEGCAAKEIMDIDYASIKYLIAYRKGNSWKFKYKIKIGFFSNEKREFSWEDEEGDDK